MAKNKETKQETTTTHVITSNSDESWNVSDKNEQKKHNLYSSLTDAVADGFGEFNSEDCYHSLGM